MPAGGTRPSRSPTARGTQEPPATPPAIPSPPPSALEPPDQPVSCTRRPGQVVRTGCPQRGSGSPVTASASDTNRLLPLLRGPDARRPSTRSAFPRGIPGPPPRTTGEAPLRLQPVPSPGELNSKKDGVSGKDRFLEEGPRGLGKPLGPPKRLEDGRQKAGPFLGREAAPSSLAPTGFAEKTSSLQSVWSC